MLFLLHSLVLFLFYPTGQTDSDLSRWYVPGTAVFDSNAQTVFTNPSAYNQPNLISTADDGIQHDILHTHVVNTSFDVLTLRKSEAIQKWRQIALLSGNSVYDNMRGHYGVTPDHDRDHRPTYIGSVDAVVNIGDINAQSQTGTGANQTLGDVAGKALSSIENKVFKFKANDFGVIMGIHSILPEAEYNAFGLEKNNSLLLTDDYFKPEYQNLGLEAIPSYEFMVEDTSSLSVLGYAPRYFGYKQKLIKCLLLLR